MVHGLPASESPGKSVNKADLRVPLRSLGFWRVLSPGDLWAALASRVTALDLIDSRGCLAQSHVRIMWDAVANSPCLPSIPGGF